MEQLQGMGWEVLVLKGKMEGVQYPEDSGRDSFKEVLLKSRFREAVQSLNPWLEESQVEDVYRKVTTYSSGSLLENNGSIFQRLTGNEIVADDLKTGKKSKTVKIIDFEAPQNNTFTAISQYKVQILGTDKFVFPDVCLFINGIPVSVIECKADTVKEPIEAAIEQLNRYAEQKGHEGQGNKELFFHNQILVATCGNIAKFGTITMTREKHFYRWTDPYPLSVQDLEDKFNSKNDQARLVAGMFDHRNLLDLIRCYTVFHEVSGKKIKIVGRYQQFRAVKKILERIRNGRSPKDRSGIVWHTQGSGKSLTMMFLVREMKRSETDGLQEWKIVFITDRSDLEEQLSGTSNVIGYSVKTANKIREVPELLSDDTSNISMVMIQKFQSNDIVQLDLDELNTSDRIIVMTDEAHRSQYKELRAQLDSAMPNATHVGFTGTPIEKTETVFGDYIDKYTMRQAIDDGVTLEIVYEGRTHNADLPNQEGVNAAFLDVFGDYDGDEQKEILLGGKRVTRQVYLEAWETIKAKAKDMVDHYVEHVFTNGFKAQVVATSRLACVRYKEALDQALKEKIAELKAKNPWNVDLNLLEAVETGVVISGSQNDTEDLAQHTNSVNHKSLIDRFKISYNETGDRGDGTVGILIVNNMLLTGFDAPVEQVMYLDRVIVAHNLLQAIARVNRVGPPHKEVGFIVDYVGVGHHLKKALNVYDELETKEILSCMSNDSETIDLLHQAIKKMDGYLKANGLTDLEDTDLFFDLFYDDALRFNFIVLYKELSKAVDAVLPKKEALPFIDKYKQLSAINVQAGKHTRDSHFSMKGVSEKLRAIVDEYLESQGIDQKIPPLSIMDKEFMSEVTARKRAKTKAAEIEHAIRNYLEENMDNDPELYATFAELLQEILERHQDNWDAVYDELKKLLERLKAEEEKETYGLQKHQMKFYRLLHKELFDNEDQDEDTISNMVNLTQEIVNILKNEMQLNGFWDSHRKPDQNRMGGEIQRLFLKKYKDLDSIVSKRKHLLTRVMELAKANNDEILYS